MDINLSKYRNSGCVFAESPNVPPIIPITQFWCWPYMCISDDAGEGERGNYFYRQAVMTNWFSPLNSRQWTRHSRLNVSLPKWRFFSLFSFTDHRRRVIKIREVPHPLCQNLRGYSPDSPSFSLPPSPSSPSHTCSFIRFATDDSGAQVHVFYHRLSHPFKRLWGTFVTGLINSRWGYHTRPNTHPPSYWLNATETIAIILNNLPLWTTHSVI